MPSGTRWRPPPRWLSGRRAERAEALLLCVPSPGYGAGMFRAWPRTRRGVQFCPIELPGRDSRSGEPAAGHLDTLAEEMAGALAPYLDRPFAFFGHGEAALLGYEATARMAVPGRPVPRRLYVSAQPAPHHGPHDRLARLSRRALAGELSLLLHRLSEAGSPAALGSCLRLVERDLAMLAGYRPVEPVPLPCPVVAIGWRWDGQVDHRSMRGWAECGPTTFVVLDGDHQAVAEPPASLLDLLADGLVTNG